MEELIAAIQKNDLLELERLWSQTNLQQTTVQGDNFLHIAAYPMVTVSTLQWIMNRLTSLAKQQLLSQKNKRGYTPLHVAAYHPDTAVIALLLANGADVKATDLQGYTPLHLAINQAPWATVACLLEKGADAFAVNAAGDRAWHRSIGFKRQEFIATWLAYELEILGFSNHSAIYAEERAALEQAYVEAGALHNEDEAILENLERSLSNWLKILHPKRDAAWMSYLLVHLSDVFLLKADQCHDKTTQLFKRFEYYAQAMQYAVAAEMHALNHNLTKLAHFGVIQQQRVIYQFLGRQLYIEDVLAKAAILSPIAETRTALKLHRKQLEQQLAYSNASASKLLHQHSDWVDKFIQVSWQKVIDVVGQAPCEFALLALGSLARKEACAFSDIETALLLSENTAKTQTYFIKVTQLWWLYIIGLGETKCSLLTQIGEYSVTYDGLSMDKGGNNPITMASVGLMGTPKELASYQNDEQFEQEIIASNTLKTVRLLIGEKALLNQYKLMVKETLEVDLNQVPTLAFWRRNDIFYRRQAHALQLLKGHAEEFKPQLNYEKACSYNFNVKAELYRLPSMMVECLAFYYGIQAQNTLERLHGLIAKKVFSATAEQRLKQLFETIFHWRLKTHLFYDREYEVLWYASPLQQEQQTQGEKTYVLTENEITQLKECYQILLPLYDKIMHFIQTPTENVFERQVFWSQDPLVEAEAHLRLSNIAEARAHYERALALNPQALEIWCNLLLAKVSHYQQGLSKQQHDAYQISQWLKLLFYQLYKDEKLTADGLNYYHSLPAPLKEQWKDLLAKKADHKSCLTLLKNIEQSTAIAWEDLTKAWESRLKFAEEAIKQEFECAQILNKKCQQIKKQEEKVSSLEQVSIHYLAALQLDHSQQFDVLYLYLLRTQVELQTLQETMLYNQRQELRSSITHFVKVLAGQTYQISVWLNYYKKFPVWLREDIRVSLLGYIEAQAKQQQVQLDSQNMMEAILRQLNNYPDEVGIRGQWETHRKLWGQNFLGFGINNGQANSKEKTAVHLVSPLLAKPIPLKAELIAALFDANLKFKDHKINGSCHDVIKISVHAKDYYVKACPEMPGMTYLVEQLHGRLLGHGVSRSEFAKLVIGSTMLQTTIPILVSEAVAGESLHRVLKHTPKLIEQLDKRQVQELALVAMLINPEDGKPDNYIVSPSGKDVYTLISIDHDHALFPSWTLAPKKDEPDEKEAVLHVRTILYCLPQMDLPFDEVTREALLAINPNKLLRSWLWDAQQQNQAYQKLFGTEDANVLHQANDQNSTTVPIPIKKGDVTKIYLKLMKLQELLRLHPDITPMQLLLQLDPRVGLQYIQAKLAYPDNIFDCFQSVGQYPVALDGSLVTSSMALQTLRLQTSLVQQAEYTKLADLDPAQGIAELDLMAYQFQQLDMIRQEVEQGDLGRYRLLVAYHAEIINGDKHRLALQFKKVPKELHDEIVLKALNHPLQVLNLTNAKLKPATWEKIIELQGPNLRELDISTEFNRDLYRIHRDVEELARTQAEINALTAGSNSNMQKLDISNQFNLTQEQVHSIIQGCPILQRLNLKGLSIDTLKDVELVHLEELNLNDSTVETLAIKVGKLKLLRIKNCTHLNDIYLLNNSSCQLEIQTTAGSKANVYTNYPWLTNLPLSKQALVRNDQLVLQWMTDQLTERSGADSHLEAWFNFLSLREKNLLQHILTKLLQALKDKGSDARRGAAQALGELSAILLNQPAAIQESVLQKLLYALNDENSAVRQGAAQALGQLSAILLNLPAMQASILQALLEALKDENSAVRQDAAQVLGQLNAILLNQPAIQEEVLQALLQVLKVKYNDVRWVSAYALGQLSAALQDQPAIQEEVLQVLLETLQDKDSYVRRDAAKALGQLNAILLKQPAVQASVLQVLLQALQDKDSYVRRDAAQALGQLSAVLLNEPAMQASVLQGLLQALQDKDSYVRRDAAQALGQLSAVLQNQPAMQASVSQALLQDLKDRDSYVRQGAAKALGELSAVLHNQPVMLEQVLQGLLKTLKDEASYVREGAAKALGQLSLVLDSQLAMQASVLQMLLQGLQDENSYYARCGAVQALSELGAVLHHKPVMLEQVLHGLALALKDKDSLVRQDTVQALGQLSAVLLINQPAMQASVLQALLQALQDKVTNVRQNAAQALGQLSAVLQNQPAMQTSVLQGLLQALKDEDRTTRWHAAQALGELSAVLLNQPAMQALVLQRLLLTLKDKYSFDRLIAAQALGELSAILLNQPAMQASVLQELLLTLKDEHIHVRQGAARAMGQLGTVLFKRSVMQESVLQMLLQALQDEDSYLRWGAAQALSQICVAILQTPVVSKFLAWENSQLNKINNSPVEQVITHSSIFSNPKEATVPLSPAVAKDESVHATVLNPDEEFEGSNLKSRKA